jgi:hypothetical protein
LNLPGWMADAFYAGTPLCANIGNQHWGKEVFEKGVGR